jgi:hypothetical protein
VMRVAYLALILRFYVDDITVLWQAIDGQKERANSEFEKFLKFCEFINLVIHKIKRPSTFAEVLGWAVDTIKMEVSLTTCRKDSLLQKLGELEGKNISKKKYDSLVGVVSFCAQVIPCLRAPLKHLICKQTIFRQPEKMQLKSIPLGDRDRFIVRWLKFCLEK